MSITISGNGGGSGSVDNSVFSGGKLITQGSNWNTATSGTGLVAAKVGGNTYNLASGSSLNVGFAKALINIQNSSRDSIYFGGGWEKPINIGFRFSKYLPNVVSNSIVWRYSFGKSNSGDIGDIASSLKAVQVKQVGEGNLQLLVSNGTTLTTVTSTWSPPLTYAYGYTADVLIKSLADGTVELYVNDVLVASTIGGATGGASINSQNITASLEKTDALDTGNCQVAFSDFICYFAK